MGAAIPAAAAWAAPYVGLAYVKDSRPASLAEAQRRGVFCWSLFALVQRERFGFDIAEYEGPIFDSRRDAAAIGEAARAFADRFVEIPAGYEREGDAVLLRLFGVPLHVGVVVAPGWMLHAAEHSDSACVEYRDVEWRDRVIAFYRAEYRRAA